MRKRPLAWVALCFASAACSRDLQVPTAASDQTPPSRITDLQVEVVPSDGGLQIRFAWGAPYDPDDAQIDRFEMRASPDPVTEDAFDNLAAVQLSPLTRSAGRLSASAVSPPRLPRYYFAIRSRDAAGNASPVGLATGGPVSLD